MADLSDVVAALRALATTALYPPGLYPSGPAGASIAGCPVLVQSGWPDPESLKRDIAAKKAQVTIYPQPTERNTTRYPREWKQVSDPQPHTFTLTQATQAVIIGGAQPATFYPQNLAVFVNGKPYLYQTQANDTLATIATALAALIVADVPGTFASGAVIVTPNTARIGALRVGTAAIIALEAKRQERQFSLIIWAPSPALRDAIAPPIDVAIGITPWLTLADGTRGRMIYKGSPYNDFDQKVGAYRRDFSVSVEYPTIATDAGPEVIAAKTVISQEGADGSTITPPIVTQYN